MTSAGPTMRKRCDGAWKIYTPIPAELKAEDAERRLHLERADERCGQSGGAAETQKAPKDGPDAHRQGGLKPQYDDFCIK
jgi:hypothetical protein